MSFGGEFAPKLPGYGNYLHVAQVSGTASQITATQGTYGNWTISIPAIFSLSGNTSTALASAAGLSPSAAGQCGVDTTSKCWVFYDGAAAQKLNPEEFKSWNVYNSGGLSTVSSLPMFKFKSAATITQVSAVITGSSTPSISIQLGYGTDITSLTNVFSSAQAITSTTTGSDLTSFSASSPAAGAYLCLTTSSISGTVTSLNINVYYKF